MSRRLELTRRMRKLSEIGEIMGSMKNLALMEARKLGALLEVQSRSVHAMEAAAADFLRFFRQEEAGGWTPDGRALLIIGSERGFCGDFNEELIGALPSEPGASEVVLLAVGEKLGFRLESRGVKLTRLPAPVVAEEVSGVLDQLLRSLEMGQRGACHPWALSALHHRAGIGVCQTELLPPFADLPDIAEGHPPQLNLTPAEFFGGLVDHYLFAALHEIFYTSLLAESQARARHLEGAMRRLDEKLERLGRENRAMRQEEITEEIEIILLGAEGLGRK